MIAFAGSGVPFSSARECSDQQRSVTIQIHDYSRVPAGLLSHASAIVTRLYEKIGVRTEWFGVMRPHEPEILENRPKLPIAQLTLNMLTTEMAVRGGRVAKTTLGFAAVASQGMGRIAYVIYDRVRSTAADAAMKEGDLLGFVMAHEIGHLLLPRGSHPSTGLMRGHWHVRDFQGLDVLTLGFSAKQASQMRDTIENETPLIARAAVPCGQP
jgi:hypothetical protein